MESVMARLERRPNWTDTLRLVRPVPSGIVVGGRFVAAEYRKVTWEIAAISHYLDEPIAHARLIRVGAPYDTKTVSVEVLNDRRFFQIADDS
jgi:hypothetical protein